MNLFAPMPAAATTQTMVSQTPPPTAAYTEAFNALQHKNARNAINMIKGAEGAEYNTLFGGGTFKSFDRHPDRVVKTKNYASAAAGAGQFMPNTWDAIKKKLRLTDFSPQSQDLGIIHLMQQRGVDPTQPMTRQMAAKLAPEWASIPTMSGKSYYGQPVKNWNQLMKFYNSKPSVENINLIKGGTQPKLKIPTVTKTEENKFWKSMSIFGNQSSQSPSNGLQIAQVFLDDQFNAIGNRQRKLSGELEKAGYDQTQFKKDDQIFKNIKNQWAPILKLIPALNEQSLIPNWSDKDKYGNKPNPKPIKGEDHMPLPGPFKV